MLAPSSQNHAAAGAAPLADHARRNRTYESSSTSRWRFNRSSTNLQQGNTQITVNTPSPVPSMPVQATKLERIPSKMSLFNLFSRPKVEKARGHTEVGLVVPTRPQTPTKQVPIASSPKSSLRHNPSPPAQQTIRSRSSQIFRPMSIRPTPLIAEFGNWEPPPLFQALSQSIKHATVQACVFPPEVLMRTQSQRRQFEQLREKMDHVRDLSAISEIASEAKKLEKTHKRFTSNSAQTPLTPELVDKVYVLVPTGYVLQYARNGPFDRSPEKVLKLGKESAAFACDLIPGKHWVLQISSHAHNDGTIEPSPRNTLLARLRSQSSTVRKGASNFLLVLDSAVEMDAWMTSVRREIDAIGGTKAKEESVGASLFIDEAKRSAEIHNAVDKAWRDSTTKPVQLDSPPQSQYSGSPKIIASDWETEDSGRTASLAESSSEYSSRRGTTRQSVEMSSAASTPVSQYQVQLDQLRRRSRFSFISNATTVSGPGTRNTSPDSSLAPRSPVQEDPSLAIEAEPLRSAMSLKSFHMNPSNNGATSRRRSMQPLPVTDEHFPSSLKLPAKRQRHSLYSPTLPIGSDLGNLEIASSISLPKKSTTQQILSPTENVTPHIITAQSTFLKIQTELINQVPITIPLKTREDSPLRPNTRSYSIPPRVSTISPPPPTELPPMPPRSAPRQPLIGTPQAENQQSASSSSTSAPGSRASQRLSATPRPFFRPLPIRPQTQHRDDSIVVPRRQSSLTPTSAPTPLSLSISVNRSVTATVRPPSEAASLSSTVPLLSAQTVAQSSQAPHHQSAIQTRSDPDPVPVLTSRRVRAISSMPSFVPGRRSSNAPTSAPRQLQSPPSIDVLRERMLKQKSQSQSMQRGIVSRQSMSAIGLPPPAPPPNMPLPSIPSNLPPALPPNMPPPVPPPNMPLPLPPSIVTPRFLST